ncbi:hypothetical protein [Ferruginibacter sp. HRS2-29]|uniref:hypothetical protein n=1 Tax=Ferruginibacter sp. HRS2-29 TaxID=2487334 RepID=UPI0020CBE960|nr:hypothetical protein [Ferruginibacter sp. HRS2-29]
MAFKTPIPYLNSKKCSQTIPISFYNSDNSKKFRVIVTGIMADGKLLYIQKIVE